MCPDVVCVMECEVIDISFETLTRIAVSDHVLSVDVPSVSA
jgi:hypothetical protein